jgi:hypothetical protein
MFSKRARIGLAVAGLLIIVLSLAVLAFALRSPEHVRTQMTLIPTLLTPPVGVP